MQRLAEANWALGAESLIVLCESQAEARARVIHEYQKWADLAARFCRRKALLKYPRCRQPFEVLASSTPGDYGSILTPSPSPSPSVPTIYAPDLPITPRIMRALDTLAENPEGKYFLSRISPDLSRQIQIAATESTRDLIVGATPKQVIGRNRRDFWALADLMEFEAELRQRFSVGAVIDYQFRGFSPVTRANWRRFTSQATCIEILPDGSLIQLGQTFEAVAIAEPVGAR